MRANFIKGGFNEKTYVVGSVYWDECDKEYRIIQLPGDEIQTVVVTEIDGKVTHLKLRGMHIGRGKYVCEYVEMD